MRCGPVKTCAGGQSCGLSLRIMSGLVASAQAASNEPILVGDDALPTDFVFSFKVAHVCFGTLAMEFCTIPPSMCQHPKKTAKCAVPTFPLLSSGWAALKVVRLGPAIDCQPPQPCMNHNPLHVHPCSMNSTSNIPAQKKSNRTSPFVVCVRVTARNVA